MARLGPRQAFVYAAEQEALAGAGVRWRRVRGAQEYADRLVEADWFVDRFPHFVACTVKRRGSGSVWSANQPLDSDGPGGRPTEGVVVLADGALTQAVLLHEVAHLLAPPGCGHGPDFAEVHLELVRREMGFHAFAAYRSALRRNTAYAAAGSL